MMIQMKISKRKSSIQVERSAFGMECSAWACDDGDVLRGVCVRALALVEAASANPISSFPVKKAR